MNEKRFTISAAYISRVLRRVEKANRRAERFGWPKTEVEIVGDHWEYPEDYPFGIKMIDLVMRSEPMQFNGWRFVATLEPGGLGNTIRSVEDVPERFRTSGMICDHCGQVRRRSRVYVIRHDDHGYKQVGSACLKDFIGGHNVEGYAAHFDNVLRIPYEVKEESGNYCHHQGYWQTEMVLTVTCRIVREYGWVSRRSAELDHKTATVARVYDQFSGFATPLDIEDQDREKAKKVLAWLRGLADKNDLTPYEWNLTNVASQDEVRPNEMGILASGVSAYDREMERLDALRRKAEKSISQYQGTVGRRQEFGPLTVKFVREFGGTRYSYYDDGVRYLHIFEDEQGNQYAWWSSGDCFEEGDVVAGRATVKKHEINKFGDRQTVLTRCKFEVVEPAGTQ